MYARTSNAKKNTPILLSIKSLDENCIEISFTSSKKPIEGLNETRDEFEGEEVMMMIHLPFRLQSAHNLFSGLLRSSLRVFACLSVIALSCRDMIEAQYVTGMKASLLALVRVEIRRRTRAHHVYDTRRVLQCTRTMPPQYPSSVSLFHSTASKYLHHVCRSKS